MHTLTTLIAIAALLTAAGTLGLLVLRHRKARVPTMAPPGETDTVRHQLAVLKVAFSDGTIDEALYRDRRRELAKRLLELSGKARKKKPADRRSQGLAALAVGALALGIGLLWWQGGRPPAADAPPPAAAGAASAAHPLSANQLENTVAQMRDRVKANPKDATGWAMLAHSYDMLGRHADAGAAYAKLVELVPGDAQVLADYADSLALARDRRFDGEPLKLIERALALDPKNLKALALAGTEAFDRKDADKAIGYWQRARAQVTDAALGAELEGRIAEAQAWKAGTVAAAPGAASAAAGFVAGRIVLSEALKAKVSPEDTLFVFARPAQGSKMPVALMRRRVSELPLEFRLDDTMAMVPQTRLSTQAKVVVGARISKRGDASPQPGDLQGLSAPVAPGAQGLRVDISEVVK